MSSRRNATTKAQQLEPPRRSLIERALNWYDNHSARLQWRAVHFTGGSFPGGAGFAYGVGVTEQAMGSDFVGDDQPNRIDGDAFAAQSLRGYRRFGASMDVRNFLARPIDLSVRWQDYQLPQEDFYGLGSSTPKSMRSNYRLDGNEYGTRATWRPTGTLSVGSDLSYPDRGSGIRNRPAIRLDRNGVRRGQRARNVGSPVFHSRRCLHGIRLARQRHPPAPRRPLPGVPRSLRRRQ